MLEREGPLVKKIDAVQFNAKLSNPLNAISVPRFLIQQEVDRALSAAEESAKSSTKKRSSILDRLGPPVENRVKAQEHIYRLGRRTPCTSKPQKLEFVNKLFPDVRDVDNGRR